MDLVTGGGGYLGSHVARALAAEGRAVRILDLRAPDRLPPGADFLEGDMRDEDTVREALEGVERVFHIAFVQSLSQRPEEERRAVNIGGMRNLLEASLAAGVARFVFASTIELYGTQPPLPCPEDGPTDAPVGWYGEHKLRCEEMLWEAVARGLPGTALRMPTICGRGFYNHRPLLALMDRLLAHRAVAVVGDGSIPGDFVAVEDVVAAFLLAGTVPAAVGEAFNVSARGRCGQRQIIEAMREAAESRSRILRVPRWCAWLAVKLGRWLGLHDLPAYQDGYVFHPNCYAIGKARRLLGYAPGSDTAEAAAALVRGYRVDRVRVRARAASY